MTFQCWVFRRWVFRSWLLRRCVFEAYYREYPTRNLELGIPDIGHSRRWVFQMLGIPYDNPLKLRYNARAYIIMRASYGRIDNKYILGNPKECVSVIILRKR